MFHTAVLAGEVNTLIYIGEQWKTKLKTVSLRVIRRLRKMKEVNLA